MKPQSTPYSLGDRAECAFMNQLLAHGFTVSRPYSAASPYDVIVDNGRRLWRVQVRSVSRPFARRGYFRISAFRRLGTRGKQRITSRHADFLAALVVPCGTWYIIPIAATARQSSFLLCPDIPGSKFDRYREAWHLLSHDNS